MKPQDLADLLKIKPVTLRRWAGIFKDYLSPNAQRGESQHRSYDERDIRIFSWVATLRLQNLPVDNIHELLKRSQAKDWADLPPLPPGIEHNEPVAMMPVDTAVAKLDAVQERLQALTIERDDLRERLARIEAKAEAENADLRKQLSEAHQQIIELSKELTSLSKENRQRRV